MSDQVPDMVSREAHERMTKERDELKAKVEELTKVVTDVGYRDKARSYFKTAGVPDPDWAAEFALPHIRGTELEKLDETLASERFKPLVSMASMQQAPASEAPPAEPPEPPAQPPTGFGGPNPGAAGGSPEPARKVQPSDLRGMTREQVAELDSQGLIAWSSDPAENTVPISSMLKGRSA